MPTCVDNTLSTVEWPEGRGANPPVQFDQSGAIYYAGRDDTGKTILSREGTNGELKWPGTLPVTFTNGSLAEGTLNAEIDVRAQRNSPECNPDPVPNNRACRILADAGVDNIFGSGMYPFYTSSDEGNFTYWLCFYEGDGTEVSFRLAHYRNTTTKQVRKTVEKQIEALNLTKVNVGDLAGVGTEQIDGKLATIMTIASGREIIFLIVGPGGRDGTIQLGNRIVGQIN